MAESVSTRLRDVDGILARSRNVHHVPFSQAMKGVMFRHSRTPHHVWAAECKARRVVGRPYVDSLLCAMLLCRPPPRFQVQRSEVIASIGLDQTYARSAGSTGISSYRPIQTVDASGAPKVQERMTYLNGQHYPAPLVWTALSAGAQRLISVRGPYTQDFARILPLLQPARMDAVMDSLLVRMVALLGGQLPAGSADAVRRLLSRPNTDPGGATYMVYMPPRLNRDTKSYDDMIDIVKWAQDFLEVQPLVLHLIGDGQTCIRLRDLKRKYPHLYQHVLIGNGHFHSGAHALFADVFLWWSALLCTCMKCIGKWRLVAGEWKGTVHPNYKNLEHNAHDHVQQGILPVVIAIVVYLTTVVVSPPPQLFLANPVLYFSQVRSAGGIVLCQFLRHAGLPAFWRYTSEDGDTLDDLHCLSLHKFRAAHKTTSSQISLLHLISARCTHPELRRYLSARLFVSLTGNRGASIATDKSLEWQNEGQKERNVGSSLSDSLLNTQFLQPAMHIAHTWRYATGTCPPGSEGVRTSMCSEVDALVALFTRLLGTDLATATTHNPLWHTGIPTQLFGPGVSVKFAQPWEYQWRVAAATSAGHRTTTTERWSDWITHMVTRHIFYK